MRQLNLFSKKFWNVTLYETGRAYGGHEEGGWYYDVMEPISEPKLSRPRKMQRHTLKNIRKGERLLKTDYRTGYGEHDGVNPDGYGDDDYILTGGIWGEGGFVALVHEGTDQPYYPEETPYCASKG